jgi:hypothetical protein
MNSVFAFRCWTPQHPLPSSTLVVFSGPNVFSNHDLTTAISEATRKSLSPEAVYLIYPKSSASEVEKVIMKDQDAFAPLSPETIIGLFEYGADGQTELRSAVRGDVPDALPLDDIRRQGLTTLFRQRSGMLESGPTAHFVKPSKKVDTRFLRASNALSEGSEIFFAALWLLPYLKSGMRYVHVDTSAIASVVMAALLMRNDTRIPIVRTFHSYGGMYGHNFSRDRLDLVLISASQSGSMAAEITGLVAEGTPVLTLFSAAANPAPGALCDLRLDRERNAAGFPAAEKVGDLSSSRPIKLISEQFIVEPEPPRAVVPSIKRAPPVVRRVISKLQGHGIFSANRTAHTSLGPKTIWLDVEKLQQSQAFQDWVAETVGRHIPATTKAIIYPTGGQSGKALADAVQSQIESMGGELRDVQVLSLEEIESADPKWPSQAVTIVVTGGATGHGAELQAISRALRRWAPKSYRVYLSSATIPSSNDAFELLKSNLIYPAHKFISMFEVVMNRAQAGESWEQEWQFLSGNEGNLPDQLSARLDALGDASGLTNNLFLDGASGQLALRENFAFWPVGTPCTGASQADVFVTLACVIENMRSGDVEYEHRLINDPQTHSIISAETFTRYNDGVIQAAMLRCAVPVELNYRDSPEQSTLMLELLSQMIELAERDQGEALTEFLMAIALNRLQLMDNDVAGLAKKLTAPLPSLSHAQRWLAGQITAQVGEQEG